MFYLANGNSFATLGAGEHPAMLPGYFQREPLEYRFLGPVNPYALT